jgi:hypothetical protein
MTRYSTSRNACTEVMIDMRLLFIIKNVFCQIAKKVNCSILPPNIMSVFELPLLQYVVLYHHLVVRLTQTDL